MVTETDKTYIYTTRYTDCESNNCLQKTVTIEGQEGKQIIIDLVSLELSAPLNGLATAWVIADSGGVKIQLGRWTVSKPEYQPVSSQPAYIAPSGKTITLTWFLKSSSTELKAKMRLLSYDYSIKDVVIVEEPETEPGTETGPTPEEPPAEIPARILIDCKSEADALALSNGLQELVGERVMQILVPR